MMPKSIALLLFSILVASCKNDDSEIVPLTMKDGRTIRVDFSLPHLNYNEDLKVFGPVAVKDSFEGKPQYKEVAYGADECDSTRYFQTISFGENAQSYGLNPEKTYLCRIELYKKEVPCPGDCYVYTYCPNINKMGLYMYGSYDPYLNKINGVGKEISAYVISTNVRGFVTLCTGILNVKCDKDGNPVDVYYPTRPSELEWNYTCRKRKYLED